MYGKIATATTYMKLGPWFNKSPSKISFILERENPGVIEGEAAGNRLHFLIRTELEP